MPEKNIWRKSYSTYQCLCCFHHCIVPKILIIVAHCVQSKAVTIILGICAHFFLFPIVLFFTKALEVSCLPFTEKQRTTVTLLWKTQSRSSQKEKNSISIFLVLEHQATVVGFLSTAYCLSCSYFITQSLQYLHNNSYSTVTYGCIYTGSSPVDEKVRCLSFPREHGFDKTISQI